MSPAQYILTYIDSVAASEDTQTLYSIYGRAARAIREEFVDPGSRFNPGFLGYN
jgi:hypothetical protein